LVQVYVVLHESHLSPHFFTVKNDVKFQHNRPWKKVEDPTPNKIVRKALG